ncbi:MAG: serine/threonine protein kinase [Oscillospiraceae bacterium]|nr:serine/threonine protein kinase [Oscillospiraceae bacterium]
MNEWFFNTLNEQYSLVRICSSGDMGEVSQLRHKMHGRNIIKRVYRGTDSTYKILHALPHPNIPKIYEVIFDNDTVTILEEYIEGLTISDILDSGLYKESGVITIISSLCDALDILHENGIVHRDIKPENVMIDNSGIVKLIDYSAAKIYKPHRSQDTQALGTAGYAAPEQFGIAQSDRRVDIYALGILMNVMLTKEYPSKLFYQGRLTKTIDKCTQLDPNKRYQNVTELKNDLPKEI